MPIPTDDCSLAPGCNLDAALLRLLTDAGNVSGRPAVLHLASGFYHVSSTVTFNSSVRASEVRLVGAGNSTHLSSLDNASALFVVAEGSPRIEVRALTLRGQIQASGLARGSASSLVMHSCSFPGHALASVGAALLVDGGVVEVYDTSFSQVESIGAAGGAVALLNGSLALEGCTLTNNRAMRGGAVFAAGGTLVVSWSRLEQNEATVGGGALAVEGSAAVLLANATQLRGNVAPAGAGAAFSFADGTEASLTYGLPARFGTWVVSGVQCEEVDASGDAPCDWARLPSMLGLTVSILTPGEAEDEDFPYACPPGIVGDTLEAEHQTRPTCARPCPAMFYCPAATITPLRCFAGSYCARGSSYPIPCLPGSYSSATNLTSAKQCTPTEPGYYATTGSTAPTRCTPGTYMPTTGANSCHNCPAGEYQGARGATACEACEPGYYCEEAASAPLPCPAGTRMNASLDVMTSVDECVLCPIGTSCSVGSLVASSCTPGTFNPYTNASTCMRCPAGQYQDEEGRSACKACDEGHFCPMGAAAPLPCTSGRFTSSTNLTSAASCTECPGPDLDGT